MSKKFNVNDFFSGRSEAAKFPFKYNFRSAAAFRTLSPNSSSSSDSFNDSYEQIYKPMKKKTVLPVNTAAEETLTTNSTTEKNKICFEECDTLDEMFKNIDLADTVDRIPDDWIETDEPNVPNTVLLSTVYEDNESKYRSSKSINTSTVSKKSEHFDISDDSLNNLIKRTETTKDSLEMSSVSNYIDLPIELNDTLEDVEYVCDDKNRYMLKPVSKNHQRLKRPTSVACSSADSSVIVIDSSPETSFATANDIKVIDVKDIKSEISYDFSSYSLGKMNTLTTIESVKNISVASTVSSTNGSFTTAKNNLKLIDTNDIKTETASNAKSNSWTTLDSSDDSSITPMVGSTNSSFTTAKNEVKLSESDDIKSESSSENPMFSCISYPKTASFFELERDKSDISETGKSSEYYTAVASNQSNSTISSLASQPSVSAARYNTMDDISSILTDNSTVSSINQQTDSSKNFNDSLERIEYMMRKGRELQEKSIPKSSSDNSSAARVISSPTSQYLTPSAKPSTKSTQKRILPTSALKGVTPAARAKLFTNSAKKTVTASPGAQAITPATRILKPFNRVPSAKGQPLERKFTSPNVSPGFKKPNFPTPGLKKECGQSRIPTSKNKHFEHIVSPIGAYIKNIAAPPLLANVKPTSDFFDSSYCNKIPKELDYTILSDAGDTNKPVSSLPVKFFSSSDQQRIIDAKTQKIPGGEKLNRIIGQIPTVISHEGRIHSGSPIKRNVPVDDSFANMSVMSGDISVQVVRDVKRQ